MPAPDLNGHRKAERAVRNLSKEVKLLRVPAEVIQVAIDDALRQASPFYEAMARPHIPALDQAIELALTNEGYAIVPVSELDRLRLIEMNTIKKLGLGKET